MDTLVHFTDSSVFGGAEQVMLTLLAGLDRSRWRAILFHHDEPGLAPLLEGARALGIELAEVPRLNGKRMPAGAGQFLKELRVRRPAIFHAHLTWPLACTEALVLAALGRVPVRAATTHLFVEMPRNILFAIKVRMVVSTVHRYIAVSRETANRLEVLGVPAKKIEIVYNGISVARYTGPGQGPPSHPLRESNGQRVIFTSARLTEQKGHRYLLQAAVQVPDAVFVLAGDGPERSALEKQAAELGVSDRVMFLGHRDDIPELLAWCDLFVLPSLYEGLPLSILEAMAAGKPVIASAIGGTDEAITNGETGLLVPPGNPAALAQAIRTLLSNPALAQRLAAAAKERVSSEFSAENMVRRTSRIYESLLAMRKNYADGR